MYPTLYSFGFLIISVFGTIMAIAWLLFFILLHRFSWKKWITKPVFSSIIPFTLAILFFGRIFYIFSEWVEEKFILMDLLHGNIIEFLRNFFIPQEYHFSLFGSVLGFILIFIILTHRQKKERLKYIDAILYAFLWSALLGYLAALLWGQIYGVPWHSPFSITYTHQDSIVDMKTPLFPLAILYMICVGWILFGLKKLSQKIHLPDGYIGYLGLGLFSGMVFLGEFLSGTRKDIFYDIFYLGLTQIGWLLGVIIALLGILRLTEKKI